MATHGDPARERVWTYMAYGPFADQSAFRRWIGEQRDSNDQLSFTVASDRGARPIGMAAILNADLPNRRLELGHIWYIPEAQRTGANTEATLLLLIEAFDYYRARRVEWKCDSLNEASRQAALGLGFEFEGIFRNHMIVKGRNRDTAWYAMTDADWPAVRESFHAKVSGREKAAP
jgi:RimJ/RimL family protein N-acetyltransferase